MAYFSNGSEGMVFDDECSECKAFDGCPIAMVHQLFNYEQVDNQLARDILNMLVKQEDGKYVGCQMKPLITDAKPEVKSEQNDYWLDMDIQPCVIASLIRQYNRYTEADSHQIDREIMNFKDFVNQIIVRGMLAYEPELFAAEELIKKAELL